MESVRELYYVTLFRAYNKDVSVYVDSKEKAEQLMKLAGDKRGDVYGGKIDKGVLVVTQEKATVSSVYGETAYNDFYNGFEANATERETFTDKQLKQLIPYI